MSRADSPRKPSFARLIVLSFLVGFAIFGLFTLLGYALFGHETLKTFAIDPRTSMTIYAESEFTYEPPGYLYCEIRREGQVLVPERRFMGVGSERVPNGRFTLISSGDGGLIAILLANDVVFLYDFDTQRIWPDLYTRTDEANYAFARDGLSRLGANHPDLKCRGIFEHEARNLGRKNGTPRP